MASQIGSCAILPHICANSWQQLLTLLFGRGLSVPFGSLLRLLLYQSYLVILAHGRSKMASDLFASNNSQSWLQSDFELSFDNKQYGYRLKRSATHALTAIIHEWQSTLDRGGAVLVDFKKSFDLVNNKLLLHKLLNKHVPHCLIKWFFSYLD